MFYGTYKALRGIALFKARNVYGIYKALRGISVFKDRNILRPNILVGWFNVF